MFPIQTIMAPLADKGLCLHTYPHPEHDDGTWVLKGSTLRGDKSAHIDVDGALLSQAFPPEGGKFLAERHDVEGGHSWVLVLVHGDDTEVLRREFPPNTSVFVAMKDFFTAPLLAALAPHLLNLTQTLGRM